MNENFVKTDGYFRSSSDSCDIYYSVWTPQSAPSAVVQIVHSARENIDTYGEIIPSLVSRGYVVCIHDQLGHGKSAESDGGEYGLFAEKDGDRFLIEDTEQLRALMRKKYRRLPYFLLGNGLGSLIARSYAGAYPENTLDGLIIASPYKKNLGLLKMVSWLTVSLKGTRYRSSLLHKIESGEKANEKTLCAKAYRDMLILASYCEDHHPPRSLPVFIISNSKSKMGSHGKAAAKLYEKYFNEEISDISCKFYEDSLLKASAESEMFSDLYSWIDRVVDAKIELIRQNTFKF